MLRSILWRLLTVHALLVACALSAQQPDPVIRIDTGGVAEEESMPVSLLQTAADEADLGVFFFTASPFRPNPGDRLHYSVTAGTLYSAEALNVRVQIELPAGTTFVRVTVRSPAETWKCDESVGLVSCSTPRLILSTPQFGIEVTTPSSPRGGLLTARASISSDTPDPRPGNNSAVRVTRINRLYAVSSMSDSGPGSLRETLETANRECDQDGVPCRILFQISPPAPDTGWFTIRPTSPLPPITVTDLQLDGTAQTSFTGNTNPRGPEVYLDGSALEEGSGLEVRSRGDFTVSGLVISGFPENGVLFSASDERSSFDAGYGVYNNYIGTDPTGTVAVPNRLRGVAAFVGALARNPPPWAQGPIAGLRIWSNLISGNGRSGIFIHSGYLISINFNRIGVYASSDEPLANGASGIYLGVLAGVGSVLENVIAHNSHFGIALERQVPNVVILKNSIKGNSLFGFDIGLDLTTPGGTDGVVARPVLTSARYDEATGKTTISGVIPKQHPGFSTATADLYSNAALEPKGEGETWLGSVVRQGFQPDFSFVFEGNLIGKSITATVTLRGHHEGFLGTGEAGSSSTPAPSQNQGLLHQTSEFSDPILVTR